MPFHCTAGSVRTVRTLRRPISICEINKAAGTLTIVFEVKGTGTDALANVRVGENVDILGPMGHGFTILPEAKHVVVVGGGIGNPPMLSLAQVYGERAMWFPFGKHCHIAGRIPRIWCGNHSLYR